MAEAPTGTVTFLFTDIEGSTRRWEDLPEAMRDALERHDAVLGRAIAAAGGHVVKTTGDGALAAFWTARDAAVAAASAQRALNATSWDEVGDLRVRMAIHTGAAEYDGSDYHGPALNRAARLMGLAHGGQVLVAHPTEELLREGMPNDLSLVDLGDHQLRDVGAERVFQLVVEGLPSTFPPLRSAGAGNLPLEVTSFVGRDDEVAAVASLLDSGRLVTVVGAGGVGKTRVALRVASSCAAAMPDGAWLCELAAAADGDDLEQVVASSLGVRGQPGTSITNSIVDHLRPQRLLLVLDNCEHLLGPVGSLVELVLRSCPGVRILATSREVLLVGGEQVFGLRSLAAPAATQLFLDRARAVRPEVADDAAVAEICERLDGMALAIELAAARVASMAPSDIAARLDERFRLLTGGRRNAVERHQTLRATVEWSYSLLDQRDRQVFNRLSVFPASFDLEAVVAVVADLEEWDVLDVLAALVAKSMVNLDTSGGSARYQLLETLRRYGLEQLTARGEVDDARRRHASHFADLAAWLRPRLQGPDELPTRRVLGMEIDNLRAAVSWALDSDAVDDQQLGVRIVAELGYEVSQSRDSGIGAWALRAVPVARMAPPGDRVAVLTAAAVTLTHAGGYAAAAELMEEVEPDGFPPDCATPNNYFVVGGIMQAAAGDADAAVAVLDAGQSALRDDDLFSRSNLHAVAAILATQFARFDLAVPQAVDAVRVARQCRSPSQLAIALCSYGEAIGPSDPAAARTALDESIALTEAGASDIMYISALTALARVDLAAGGVAAAADTLGKAFRHSQLLGDYLDLVGAIDCTIDLLVGRDDLEPAAVATGYVARRTAGAMDIRGAPGRAAAAAAVAARFGDMAAQLEERGATMRRDELCAYLADVLSRAADSVASSPQPP